LAGGLKAEPEPGASSTSVSFNLELILYEFHRKINIFLLQISSK